MLVPVGNILGVVTWLTRELIPYCSNSLDNTESEIKYITNIIMLSCNVHTVI